MGVRLSNHRSRAIARRNPYHRAPSCTGRARAVVETQAPAQSRPEPDAEPEPAAIAITPAGIIATMAQALMDAYAEKGDATSADLVQAGYTPAQIAEFGDHAIARAKRLFVRQVA